MTPYKNLEGNSGIVEYEIGKDCIKIKFKTSTHQYVYDYGKPGKPLVEKMKKIAPTGLGLSTFINKYVRNNYAKIVKA